MNKDINNTNNKRQYHGYQEWYWKGNKLRLRGNFKNGNKIGYQEWHIAKRTLFYIR